MIVGKTNRCASFEEVMSKYTEKDILATYFNIDKLPCLINSPLRIDNHPSFSLYLDKKQNIRYIDYATNASGSLMDLLCQYWNCSFSQAVDRIYNDTLAYTNINMCKGKRGSKIKNVSTNIEVKIREWETYDLEYWKSYGITPEYLKYAEIYPISYKVVTKKIQNKTTKSVYKASKYAYVYVERKENNLSLKIYQPFNTDGFKWCSTMDSSVISLWTKIPETGDRVIICSSLKDALCITCQLGIPAIALQGEGYNISDTAANELRRRFKKIFISFDTDDAGRKDAIALAEKTGFINIVPDLGDQKDFSDHYKALTDKTEFQKLKSLFN